MRAGLAGLLLLVATVAFAEPVVVKVVVEPTGSIVVDGDPSSLDDLRKRLGEIPPNGGEVWYHRDPHRPIPPGALEVIQVISDARLPIRLAVDPEFECFATRDGSTTCDESAGAR